MALVYFDSSALMKLVVEEAGSDLVADLWDGCDATLSSRLACIQRYERHLGLLVAIMISMIGT